MFYSEKFGAGFNVPTLVEYLNKESGETKTETYWKTYYEEKIADFEEFEKEDNYLYHIADKYTSTRISNAMDKIRRDMINTNRYEESDKVILYKDVFVDLYK